MVLKEKITKKFNKINRGKWKIWTKQSLFHNGLLLLQVDTGGNRPT